MHTSFAPYASALIVAASEGSATVDRTMLRQTGVPTVRVMTTGIGAARLLAGQVTLDDVPMPDVVLCHDTLADMTGLDFLLLVRSHPHLHSLPIIYMSSGATESEVLDAIRTGCNGFITRPYTQDQMTRQLHRTAESLNVNAFMRELRAAKLDADTSAFDAALSRYANVARATGREAEAAFQDGMARLLRKEWDRAIAAFNRAVRHNTLRAESQLGLAAAWRGKGDTVRSQQYLKEAGLTYARTENWRRARDVFSKLLQELPAAANPLLEEAARLVREGHYNAAARALAASRHVTPAAPLHPQIARACQFTPAPEEAARSVCRALAAEGEPELAKQLGQRLMGHFGRPDTNATDDDASHRFPLLHEVLAVARYTLRAWRTAP